MGALCVSAAGTERAELRPWCRVVLVTERWTSKTCGACGGINFGLGSAKTFRCQKGSALPSCGGLRLQCNQEHSARFLTVASVRC